MYCLLVIDKTQYIKFSFQNKTQAQIKPESMCVKTINLYFNFYFLSTPWPLNFVIAKLHRKMSSEIFFSQNTMFLELDFTILKFQVCFF